MIHNVPQPPGLKSTAVCDTSQQFPSRQSTLQIMAMDVARSYFSSDTSSTATASALQAQMGPSGVSQVYEITAIGGMAGQSSATQDFQIEEYPTAEGSLDTAYASYQSTLKAIFQ